MNDVLIVVGAASVFFGAMLFRGIFGYLKNRKIAIEDLKFSWKTFLSGMIVPVALTVSIGGLAGLILAFLHLVGASGVEVLGIDQISVTNLELGMFIADIGAIGFAIKEALLAFGLSEKQIEQIRETVNDRADDEVTGISVKLDGGVLVAVADNITPEHLLTDQQTNGEAEPTDAEIEEVGQGASVNPLSRRLADGDNDGGKGWQCSKYSWYLASGIRMNYAPHPDYGPCNGRDMVNYLVDKLGWKRCGKQNGAIFAYDTSTYGHTGMVVDAANNIVNDANWSPLRVGTHYINLDAVGATYCCPPDMAPAPAPTPAKKSVDDAIVSAVIRGDYGNGADRKARLEAAGYNYSEVQAVVNAKLSGGSSSSTPAPAVKIGDRVKTTSSKDQNGVWLNLKVINDGNSIWAENNSRGMAVLKTANGTVRCAVPTSSLYKA